MSNFVDSMFRSILLFLQTRLWDFFWAAVIFLVGYTIIKALMNPLEKWLVKLKIDLSFHAFLLSVIRISAIVLLAISCLDRSGLVPATSLVTALGAVGLALSLAVKDSLTNLVGGMMVLFTKPFAVGDYVDACGISGTVSEIGMIHTVINTIDNKRAYLPNGDVCKAQVINYSSEAYRRLDLTFSIGYNADFQKAQQVILDVAKRSGFALDEPTAPSARVKAHSPHSIDILCRIWVENENYWELNYYMYEQVKLAFDAENISIPYNQLDVHLTH